ncbi:MAG: DUF6174 domain-containing protein [Longimicrobiaceae bacterium]
MRLRILPLRLAAAAALALPLAVSACQSPSGADPDDLRAFTNARKHWMERGVRSYTLVARANCFCGFLGDIRTTVVNGVVTERVYVEDGSPVPADRFAEIATIDAMLETLDKAFREDADDVRATYDDRGVPTQVFIDYHYNWADEEFGWVVRSFTPAS